MARPSRDKLELLHKLLKEKGIDKAGASIPRRAGAGDAPLSVGQQRMAFVQQLEPDSSEYNDTLTVRLDGRPLEPALFRRAIAEIVRRHEVLRTAFVAVRGELVQRVLPDLDVPLRVEDLAALPPVEQEAALERLWEGEARAPFALERPPLLRTTLARLAADRFEFGLTMHHIVSDGVAYAIFFRELGALYEAFARGAPSPLTPLAIQFADYAAWERQAVTEAVIERKLPFWRRYLGGELPPLQLPVDRPRTGPRRHRGAFLRFAWPNAPFDQLQGFCRRERVTSNWVLLAAYFALWHRFSGQEDCVIGTPSSIRGRPELEALVGFFVQTLILRLDLRGNPPFREVIKRAQKAALEVALHEEVPFDRIFQAVRPGKSAAQAPLIHAWIAPMKNLLAPIELPGATSSYRIVDPKNARFDIALIVDEAPAGCTGYWEYDVDLFDLGTVERIDRQWTLLLQHVLRQPDITLGTLRDALRGEDQGARPAPRDPRVLDLKRAKRRPMS